jgi:hypothetical protein
VLLLRSAIAGVAGVIGQAARALARHWPILVVLYLAGASVRSGVLWAASWVSDRSSTLGVLLVPGASLAMLLALVAMIRAAGQQLPALSAAIEPVSGQASGRARAASTWAVATAALVPFLAVYSAQGLLREDTVQFVRDTTLDEAVSTPLTADYSRALIATGWQLVVVVGVALVLRRVIAGYHLAGRSWRWALASGYVEALWLVTLAATVASHLDEVRAWLRDRVIVAGLVDSWDRAVAAAGPFTAPLTTARDGLAGFLAALGDLVIIPVAWLAIGATVLGASLASPRPVAPAPAASPPEVPPTAAKISPRDQISARIRELLAGALEPITTPVRKTVAAIRSVAIAGVVPMTLVCLVLAGASHLRTAVVWAARVVLGPQPALLGAAYRPYVDVVAWGVYFVVAAALIAAAVDRVVTARQASSG